MAGKTRGLRDAETRKFLETNNTGFLAFGGTEPYVIPMGYAYRKETVLLGLITKPDGRKMSCLKQSSRVCFTICRTRTQTDLKHPCTTIVIEGDLETVTDRDYYGLGDLKEAVMQEMGLVLYRLNPVTISGRKCIRKPCEMMVPGTKGAPPPSK